MYYIETHECSCVFTLSITTNKHLTIHLRMFCALLPVAHGLVYIQNKWGHTDIENCIVNCYVGHSYFLIRSGRWCREHKNSLLWATPHRHGWTKTFSTPIISGSTSLIMPLGYVCVYVCMWVCMHMHVPQNQDIKHQCLFLKLATRMVTYFHGVLINTCNILAVRSCVGMD